MWRRPSQPAYGGSPSKAVRDSCSTEHLPTLAAIWLPPKISPSENSRPLQRGETPRGIKSSGGWRASPSTWVNKARGIIHRKSLFKEWDGAPLEGVRALWRIQHNTQGSTPQFWVSVRNFPLKFHLRGINLAPSLSEKPECRDRKVRKMEEI